MSKRATNKSVWGVALFGLIAGAGCQKDSLPTETSTVKSASSIDCEAIWNNLLTSFQEGERDKVHELLDEAYKCDISFPSQLLERSEIALSIGKPELAYNDACRVVRMDPANGRGYFLIVKSVGEINDPSAEQVDAADNARVILEKHQTPSESRGEDGP